MNKEDILNTPLDEASFSIIDVETTGLSPAYNNIIEIGIVKVEKLKIVNKYNALINPGRIIPYYITSLTGISTDDVFNAPFFDEVADDIAAFIGDDIITAHNLSFDKSFLRREFIYSGKDELKNPSVCTLRIARRLYPFLKRRSLGSVCSYLQIRNPSEHRALPDAEVTAKVLIRMITELKQIEKMKTVQDLLGYQFIPKQTKKSKIKKKLSEDLAVIPKTPGIYYFLNSKGEVIYIGKAKCLSKRVASYFSPTAPRKAKRIIKQASRLKIEITNSELTALLTEAEAIKKVGPRHNKMLTKYGNKYFLRVTTTHAFPSIEISNYFDFDGNDYFGLFISRNKAVSVYEILQRTFEIRECKDEEFNKKRSCFLAEIERCTAPCINSDHSRYSDELEKVYEFLCGKNQTALTRLINQMRRYSDEQKYEKASEVKQIVDILLMQTHKTSLLAEPVNKANVLFEISEGYQRDYLLMISGKIFIKKYALNEKDFFEEALDEYFEGVIRIDSFPDNEDLEKMKITLNWLIKNRNKVRSFYLKDYQNKQQLYSKLTHYGYKPDLPEESIFDIKNFIRDEAGVLIEN